jgi:tetratricopeptide (TPR) repeat protein
MSNDDHAAPQQRLERLLGYRELDPDSARLAADCAALQLQLGDVAAARALIDDALATHPDDDPLQFQLATLEIATHNPARARELLQGLLERGVDNGGVRYNLAFALALLGEFAQALAVLSASGGDLCREAPRAPLLKARLQHHLGDVAAAIATLGAFLEAQPGDAEVHGDLALLLIDADDYDGAAAAARHALATGGEHYGALVAQGMVALAHGEPEQARQCFAHTLQRREENGRSSLGLGLCELAPAWAALAWAQLGQQKPAEAEATLERAPMAADNAEIQGLLAVARVMRGHIDLAHAAIATAEALPGPAHNAAIARSLLLLQSGDAPAAAALLENTMGHPANRPGQLLLARLRA